MSKFKFIKIDSVAYIPGFPGTSFLDFRDSPVYSVFVGGELRGYVRKGYGEFLGGNGYRWAAFGFEVPRKITKLSGYSFTREEAAERLAL